ncbi:MAG: hypothetical protein KME27_14255 [Lyngbya sp. HA4199-MV5]|jgi:hypothetical protein|nr:hypothetical protein [Lyngbya sp. HA4199-MV5]
MSAIATTLVFLSVTLGANALVSIFIAANHDGLPGRRLGGGTRHHAPSLPSMLDV